MPSERFASRISDSLAQGEDFADFAYLFDALLRLRRPYHEKLEASEGIVGWLLCLFVPDKPPQYVRAMQQFRLRFHGVSTNAELQAEFYNCVRNAAVMLNRQEEVVWRPSLYFSLSRKLHEGLKEEWY
jgi:hypothetical protein